MFIARTVSLEDEDMKKKNRTLEVRFFTIFVLEESNQSISVVYNDTFAAKGRVNYINGDCK